MDFGSLTSDQVTALEGCQREAWYAYRNGDLAKAEAILAAYPDPGGFVASSVADIETAVASDSDIETAVAPRARKARR